MAAHLEHRRQAIAEALRAVMTEPLPNDPPAIPSLRDSLVAAIDSDEDEPADTEDYEVWSPPIPPVELAGAMSQTASMALFGHT